MQRWSACVGPEPGCYSADAEVALLSQEVAMLRRKLEQSTYRVVLAPDGATQIVIAAIRWQQPRSKWTTPQSLELWDAVEQFRRDKGEDDATTDHS